MQVDKSGNSLTVRLPTAAVEDTGLQEGDKIKIADERRFRIDRDPCVTTRSSASAP